jgi:integrase
MTGHIRQRSPGSWELRFTVEGKTRTATIRGTRREAEKELRKRLVSLDDGGVVDPTKLTTGQWFDQWLAIVRPEISPATYDHYQRAAKTHLKPRLGNVPLAKLSRAQVQQVFSDLAEGGRADGKFGPLAPTTRKQIYAVLNIALGRAVELQMIGTNVAQVMRRRMPKPVPSGGVVLTPEQSAQLLYMARGTGLFAPILLALSTGCRRGEAAALTWAAVDLKRGAVTFATAASQIGDKIITGPTKSRKTRVVSLGKNALEELRAWRLTQAQQLLCLGIRQGSETSVCTRADGSRIGPNAITVDFWRLAKRVGLPIHYHSLRHGHATALLIAGVHPKVAQERLGHHSVAFTLDRYSHTIERLHDDAAAKVDTIFGAGSKVGSKRRARRPERAGILGSTGA